MACPPKEGGIKEDIDADNNIIISDSTLHKVLPPQPNNMTYQYKDMCGCKCFISAKRINYSLLIWRNSCLKHFKDRIHNVQNRMYGEISSPIFETYKNAVQPHGCHI